MAKGMMYTIPTKGKLVTEELTDTPGFMKIKAAINDGFLEQIPHFRHWNGEPCVAFCDEEGKIKGLPPNLAATAIWQSQNGQALQDILVGPVVVITGDKELMSEL